MKSYRILLAVLAVTVAVLFVLSLLIGPARVPPVEALHALATGEGLLGAVMRELRLPRALLGLMIGASLGLAGAVLQGFLRNPLAEPGLIGTSSAAALGAVLAIQSGLAAGFAPALPLSALGGALVSVALILPLAGGGTLGLILAGVAVSALAGAVTSLVLNLSPNPFAATEIVFWMMGSLADRSMLHVWLAAPFLALGMAVLWPLGRSLDLLTLGEDAAASLGVNRRHLRLRVVTGIALLVGAATAVAGAIGFVGLVVPHLLRRAVGGQPSRLLPASMLGGAAMLLAADVAARLLLPVGDLKLGVLTALVGAPFFFHLLMRLRREGA
jgi:iron complex transport system permease protein